MTRCKARNPDQWRCSRPKHEGDDHGYQMVLKIRLPKSQMKLLHSLRGQLVKVENEVVGGLSTNFLRTALEARAELLNAIDELEVWGRSLADEHAARVHGELHRGHKMCFYGPDGSCITVFSE